MGRIDGKGVVVLGTVFLSVLGMIFLTRESHSMECEKIALRATDADLALGRIC